MNNVERARDLKAVLDSVSTNKEARALGEATVLLLGQAVSTLSGFSSWGVIEDIGGEVSRLKEAISRMPDDERAVDAGAWLGPTGLRVRIQSASATVWAVGNVFPSGTSWGDDWETFKDGFSSTLKAELQGIRGVVADTAGAVLDIGSPILIPALAIGLLLVVGLAYAKAKGVL